MTIDLSGLSLGSTDPSAVTVAYQDPYSLDSGTLLPGDQVDASKMQPASTSTDTGTPWWQQLIQFGITRAIDNTTQTPVTTGNVSPGSFAGANGQTYPQDIAQRTQVAQSAGAGMGMLLLLGLVVLVVSHKG